MAKLEIFENSLIKLIVRKGPNTDRLQSTLSEGEPGYTVDTKRLFVGDGTTPGGVLTGNKFIGYSTNLTTLPTVPGEVGDIAYNTSNSTLYYIQSGTGTITNNWIPISTNINTTTFDSLTTTVRSSSASWSTAYTTTTSISAKANNTYTTVRSNSANWNHAYTTVQLITSFTHYFDTVSIPGTIESGLNGTTNLWGGKFIFPGYQVSTQNAVVTLESPPIGGTLTFQLIKNNITTLYTFNILSTERFVSAPLYTSLTWEDTLHINVTSLGYSASGLKVCIIGTSLYDGS